ncbi:acylphosphatase-2 isoform X4 [Cavia porcellus]|uniref:acylphosphatase-2 isoform X4 n=1 Tax=Cavia porcellus TaxID=10141 RepID=UPI002FE2EEC7
MCLLPPSAAAAPRLLRRALAAAMSAAAQLKSVDYEVFGRVQGVCFRMYTEGEAKKIGVVGWVKNTSKGTVTGQVQGPEEKVNSICCPVGLISSLKVCGYNRIGKVRFLPCTLKCQPLAKLAS